MGSITDILTIIGMHEFKKSLPIDFNGLFSGDRFYRDTPCTIVLNPTSLTSFNFESIALTGPPRNMASSSRNLSMPLALSPPPPADPAVPEGTRVELAIPLTAALIVPPPFAASQPPEAEANW